MFPVVEAFGKKLDRTYVETRAMREPLYEVTQMKGDGETHPFLSPTDEFADFERWDKANLAVTQKHTNDMFEGEYARAALKNGLLLESKLGTNPYKFGMIGSTDAHTGLAAVEEDNFFGKTTISEPSPERLSATLHDEPEDRRHDQGLGECRPRATRPSGRRRTRAKRSSTRCSAARRTRRPARACS